MILPFSNTGFRIYVMLLFSLLALGKEGLHPSSPPWEVKDFSFPIDIKHGLGRVFVRHLSWLELVSLSEAVSLLFFCPREELKKK